MNAEISRAEISPSCEVCHCAEKLKTCSRCHCAFYCGREHQVLHWAVHKQICKDFRSDDEATTTVNRPVVVASQVASLLSSAPQSAASANTNNTVAAQAYATWTSNNRYLDDVINTPTKVISPEHPYSQWDVNSLIIQEPVSSQSLDQIPNSASETSDSDNLQIDNDLFALTTKYLLSEHYTDCNTGNVSMDYDLTSVTEQIFDHNSCSSLTLPIDVQMQETELTNCMPFEHVCSSIVHDLNVHGICVIDKFLGFEVGEQILREVKGLFQRGVFQKGQLVNSSMWKSTEGIRGDFISWISGTEPGCEYIGSLIRKLDDVMNRCSKMKDNGILSRYKLSKRTKAMVACYPGNGTHYKKHVDNPDGDGRCITCIYYLNKDWEVEKHGGLLRMFPTSHEDEIANIEPVFDRMLFFWSDRRNPHEVLPSYAIRFAITVWYFNSDERELALIKSSLQQKQ